MFSRPNASPWRKWCFLAVLAIAAIPARAGESVIYLLAPAGFLPLDLIKTFEAESGTSVRVDLVQDSTEFSRRAASPQAQWDVIIADEPSLLQLDEAKRLRPLPPSVAKANPDGHQFTVFALDPLGIAWRPGTAPPGSAPEWNWLVDPRHNPLWRDRVFSTLDWHMTARLAALASGATVPEVHEKWLEQLFLQVPRTFRRPVPDLLAGLVSAGPMWKSRHTRVQKLIPDLQFRIPQSGTLYRRFGIALSVQSTGGNKAPELAATLVLAGDRLAQQNGMDPAHQKPPSHWTALGLRPGPDDNTAVTTRISELFARINRGD